MLPKSSPSSERKEVFDLGQEVEAVRRRFGAARLAGRGEKQPGSSALGRPVPSTGSAIRFASRSRSAVPSSASPLFRRKIPSDGEKSEALVARPVRCDLCWEEKKAEIVADIEDVVLRIKSALHSDRYKDGEQLDADDEKVIVEKILFYHTRYEDKIGCGLHYLMVDKHPQFKSTRCLCIVRTDGSWVDFSYRKCLRAYIHGKYPDHAERFIKEQFPQFDNLPN